MSKAKPLLFVIAGILVPMVNATQPAQPPVKTTGSEISAFFAEKAKWNILRMQLAEKLDGSQKFANKVGAVMNNYAPCWTMLVGIGYLLMVSSDASSCSSSAACSSQLDSSSSFGSFSNSPYTQGTVRKSLSAAALTSLALLELVTYGICKIGGARLEDKASQALRVLTEFAQQWDMHKIYTPVVLHELFESYANDLKAHGKLTTVDKVGARKVVESILAMVVIAETIK